MATIVGYNATVSIEFNGDIIDISPAAQDTILERMDPGYIGVFNPLRKELAAILDNSDIQSPNPPSA